MLSSTLAMASRTSVQRPRITQPTSVGQRYVGQATWADWLAQGLGASGPSMMRTTSPMVMSPAAAIVRLPEFSNVTLPAVDVTAAFRFIAPRDCNVMSPPLVMALFTVSEPLVVTLNRTAAIDPAHEIRRFDPSGALIDFILEDDPEFANGIWLG